MEQGENKKTGFLVQGTILAVASIISRIIGLLYRLPLTGIIGKRGNNYYGTAFEVYSIMLIISAYSIPLAVSKLVAAKKARGEMKNIDKILKGSLLFAAISGGGATLIVFFGADFFTGDMMLRTPLASIALRVLAPVILIVAVVGVLRGFFQGLGSMMPSAISQIIEQIINAVVSVAAAYFLFSRGKIIGAILNNPDEYAAAYGAAGGTLGTAIGALSALLFMAFIYLTFSRSFKRKIRRDKSTTEESYGSILKVLVLTIVPVLLSTTLYNISAIIDTGLFKQIANIQGYDQIAIDEWWGVFTGQYRVIINVPVSIASAMAASSVPALTEAFHLGDHDLMKSQIDSATRLVMIIAIPCMVGLAVLAGPIMQLLFGDTDPVSGYMLLVGSISVVFYSLSTLSNGLLQGIDKMRLPVIHAAIALVAQAVFLVLCMFVFRLNIFAVVLANAFYALLMCVLNGLSLYKYSKVRSDIQKTYIRPALASLIMGVVTFGVFQLTMLASHRNSVSCIVAIVIAIPVYFVTILLLGGISEKEIRAFPKGDAIVGLTKRLHLLKEETKQ